MLDTWDNKCKCCQGTITYYVYSNGEVWMDGYGDYGKPEGNDFIAYEVNKGFSQAMHEHGIPVTLDGKECDIPKELLLELWENGAT